MRKSTSRISVTQTSTPFSDYTELASFKTFENVSSIRNEYSGIRQSVIETPTMIDWSRSSTNISETTKSYRRDRRPSKKRRLDTPLKSKRKFRFADSSIFRSLKSKFPKTRSSIVNAKLSEIKRRCRRIANKQLLRAEEKPESKKEGRRNTHKETADDKLCSGTNYGANNFADSADDILHERDAPSSRSSKRRCLLQKERANEGEVSDNIRSDSSGGFVGMIDDAEPELLCTSESFRSESTGTVVSNTVEYFSGLSIVSDGWVTTSATEQNSENSSWSDDNAENIKRYVEDESNFIFNRLEKANLIETLLPEANVSISVYSRVNETDRTVLKGCETFVEAISNEIEIGKLEQSKTRDGQQSSFPNKSDEKEIRDEHKLRLGEKSDEKYTILAKSGRKQVTQGTDLEQKEDKLIEQLNSANKVQTSLDVCFGCVRPVAERSDGKTQEKNCKKHEECQRKDLMVSNNSENKTHTLDVRRTDHSKCIQYATEIVNEIFSGGADKKKAKEHSAKSKKKHKKRQEQEKKVKPKCSFKKPVKDSSNTRCSSDRSKVETFMEPSTVKKNAVSKRTVMAKGRKRKMTSLYPLTSTPFSSVESANESLPVELRSLSPVVLSKKSYGSYPLDDLLPTKIEAKKTKTGKNCQKYDEKNIPKWKSFRRKTSHRGKNNNYVSDLSQSSGSNSFCLFESPPYDVNNEGFPLDDILILWNRFRRSKYERRCGNAKRIARLKHNNDYTKRGFNKANKVSGRTSN